MKVFDVLRKVATTKALYARDPRLGPREVGDKQLDGLERQRQAQLNEERKRYLRQQINNYQQLQSRKAFDDGINHLSPDEQQRHTFKKPPVMRYFERTRL